CCGHLGRCGFNWTREVYMDDGLDFYEWNVECHLVGYPRYPHASPPAAHPYENMTSTSIPLQAAGHHWAWLPKLGTWKYYALLGAVGILVLGPLGGVAASYMNFSLGFFVGGQ